MHGRSDKARRVELVQGLRNIVVHPDHGFRAGAAKKNPPLSLGWNGGGSQSHAYSKMVPAREADTKMSERVTPHARIYFAEKPTVVNFVRATPSATFGRGVKTVT